MGTLELDVSSVVERSSYLALNLQFSSYCHATS